MKRIAKGWEEYRRRVVPATAGATQVEESRRAFYAGCWHLFATVMSSLDEGTESTEKDAELIGELHAEMVDFANSRRN